MNSSEINQLKEQLIPFFEIRPEILFAYLFGSQATGQTNPMSDIDIAVAIDHSKIRESDFPYGYASFLTSQFMGLLKTNAIDVVLLDKAPPALKYSIFGKGVCLFSRNEEHEKQIYLQSLRRYQDTTSLRRIQQYYFKQYLKGLGKVRHGKS